MTTATAITNESGMQLMGGLDIHGGIKPVETADSIASIWKTHVDCNNKGRLGDLLSEPNMSMLANHLHRQGIPLNTEIEWRGLYKKAKHIRDIIVPGKGTYRESRGRIVFRKFR